ncbi:MAG: hypothetical protein HQL19_06995 [Candidatus Omnitrophica bacterium]|nr:hypothetical protein [Candidatus Omnitrophota bacterium]
MNANLPRIREIMGIVYNDIAHRPGMISVNAEEGKPFNPNIFWKFPNYNDAMTTPTPDGPRYSAHKKYFSGITGAVGMAVLAMVGGTLPVEAFARGEGRALRRTGLPSEEYVAPNIVEKAWMLAHVYLLRKHYSDEVRDKVFDGVSEKFYTYMIDRLDENFTYKDFLSIFKKVLAETPVVTPEALADGKVGLLKEDQAWFDLWNLELSFYLYQMAMGHLEERFGSMKEFVLFFERGFPDGIAAKMRTESPAVYAQWKRMCFSGYRPTPKRPTYATLKPHGDAIRQQWANILSSYRGVPFQEAYTALTNPSVIAAARAELFDSLSPAQENKPVVSGPGGIDLTADRMDPVTTSSGTNIQFNIDSAQLAEMQSASGITPVIINIQPMTDFNAFFELKS